MAYPSSREQRSIRAGHQRADRFIAVSWFDRTPVEDFVAILRFLMRTSAKSSMPFIPAIGVVILSASLMSSAFGSTEPVRNRSTPETDTGSTAVNPIFYPLTTEAAGNTGVAPEAILRQFLDKHTAMDYPAAAEAALRLVAAIPDRPEGHYNLACAMSRMRRVAEAMAALNDAVDHGWRDVPHMVMDPDLAGIRSRAEFAALVERVRSLIESERIAPVPLRMSPWEQIAADVAHRAPELQQRHHVPGLSVALINNGEMVWSSTFGIRDRRDEQPLSIDDRFRVRGPIDLMTLMACQQQHDQGRLELAKLLEDGASLAPPPPPVRVAENPGANDGRPRLVPTGSRSDDPRSLGVNAPRPVENDTPRTPGSPQSPRDCHPNDARPTTVDGFLRFAVEMSSNTGFATYCETQVLGPLMMSETSFVAPESTDGAIVTGHSLLGSPMQWPVKGRAIASGAVLYSTASDLASLITQTMRASSDAQSNDDEAKVANESAAMFIELLAAVRRDGGGTLGLSIDVRDTPCGIRVQVADVSMGSGCLMRWYPQTRNGIVVLFNSATGLEAAERLAHLALGGE